MAVRDTIPAIPPANNALHIIMDGGGSGGGTKSEPAIICLSVLPIFSRLYDLQACYSLLF